MNQNSFDANAESGIAAREYYRMFSLHSIEGHTDKSRTACRELAMIYNASLDALVICLRKEESTPEINHRIQQTMICKRLVASNAKYF